MINERKEIMDGFNIKRENLKQLSEYRKSMIHNPPLRNLFLELTLRCNEHCIHCGSSCGEVKNIAELSLEHALQIIRGVKENYILLFDVDVTYV